MTAQEILGRWYTSEEHEKKRVLQYITTLEDAYTILREKLADACEDVTSLCSEVEDMEVNDDVRFEVEKRLNDMDNKLPDPDRIETLEEIQNDH